MLVAGWSGAVMQGPDPQGFYLVDVRDYGTGQVWVEPSKIKIKDQP